MLLLFLGSLLFFFWGFFSLPTDFLVLLDGDASTVLDFLRVGDFFPLRGDLLPLDFFTLGVLEDFLAGTGGTSLSPSAFNLRRGPAEPRLLLLLFFFIGGRFLDRVE